jgi:hypothetical protein
LTPFANALFPIGMADAFLLGNLRGVRQSGLGLAIVICSAATLVYNIPDRGGRGADADRTRAA